MPLMTPGCIRNLRIAIGTSGCPKEEQLAYETILTLRPHDHDTRFKLGSLYFQQGENAKGLKLYEEPKKAHYEKATELLAQYGK